MIFEENQSWNWNQDQSSPVSSVIDVEYYSIVRNSSDNGDSENSGGGALEPVFSRPTKV